MPKERIVIGGDHAGFGHKQKIVQFLIKEGFEVLDMGPHSTDSVDYPDFVHPVADTVENGKAAKGIVVCGSGNGVAITANKHQGIRAALSWTEEIATLARQHNDANVLAIPARFVDEETTMAMVKSFLTTDFEGGRHDRRVKKIHLDS